MEFSCWTLRRRGIADQAVLRAMDAVAAASIFVEDGLRRLRPTPTRPLPIACGPDHQPAFMWWPI